MEFIEYNSQLIYKKGSSITINQTNVLFLDYDGTIIVQKNGKIPRLRKKDDWKFFSSNVKTTLENYNGICVIISNQKNLKDDKKTGFIEQISDVFSQIKLKHNPWIFVAIGDDFLYRKPSTGTINVLCKLSEFNPLEGDFYYIGDACGRPDDHSACDLHFAENLGWGFKTPEMFFNQEQSIIPEQINIFALQPQPMQIPIIPDNIKILFLQAPPASGKTTIAQKLTQFYRINQDELKTLAKCVKMAKEKLQQGKRIIIDRTNPNKESMAPFMELDANYGILTIKIDKWMNRHLNCFRAWANEENRIPEIAYNIYWKKYEKPKMEDGYKWIGEVEWQMEEEKDEFKRYFF